MHIFFAWSFSIVLLTSQIAWNVADAKNWDRHGIDVHLILSVLTVEIVTIARHYAWTHSSVSTSIPTHSHSVLGILLDWKFYSVKAHTGRKNTESYSNWIFCFIDFRVGKVSWLETRLVSPENFCLCIINTTIWQALWGSWTCVSETVLVIHICSTLCQLNACMISMHIIWGKIFKYLNECEVCAHHFVSIWWGFYGSEDAFGMTSAGNTTSLWIRGGGELLEMFQVFIFFW